MNPIPKAGKTGQKAERFEGHFQGYQLHQNRMTKAGKTALAIRMASPKEMRIIVGNVMYHLTTGKPYTIEA